MSVVGFIVVLFVVLLSCFQIAIDLFVLFHHSICDYMGFTVMFYKRGRELMWSDHIFVISNCIKIKKEVSHVE